METSPSQSSGQGGGVWWSVQTGHPTAVTDGFHQGAHGLTGEMYMETAAKGADIYLPAAPLARMQEESRKDGEFSEERHRKLVASVLKAIIEQLLHALYKFVVTGKRSVGRRSNPKCDFGSETCIPTTCLPAAPRCSNSIASGDILRLK
ncbi:hypothetical protein ABVT39_011879 [Epinephelus coioides]